MCSFSHTSKREQFPAALPASDLELQTVLELFLAPGSLSQAARSLLQQKRVLNVAGERSSFNGVAFSYPLKISPLEVPTVWL